MTRDIPRHGEIWRHFKGNLYRIEMTVEHTETGETLVVYRRSTERTACMRARSRCS